MISVLLPACGRTVEYQTAPPGDAEPTDLVESAQPRGTIVRTRDGTRFFGDEAAVDVYNYDSPNFPNRMLLQLLGGAGSDLWTAQTQLQADAFPNVSGTAQIGRLAIGVGVANLERLRNGRALYPAASGKFSYSLNENGRLTIDVSADSDLVSGTVDASFQVRCWVRPAELGLDENGHSPDSGGVSTVLDTEYRTRACAPYKAYGP
jgi:hypothetical protein